MWLVFVVGFVSLTAVALENFTDLDRKCVVNKTNLPWGSEHWGKDGWRCKNKLWTLEENGKRAKEWRKCYPIHWFCDGINICNEGDGGRESYNKVCGRFGENGTCTNPFTGELMKFSCKSGSKNRISLVELVNLCDGYPNYNDGSDEGEICGGFGKDRSCTNPMTGEVRAWRCRTGSKECIAVAKLCDKRSDCDGGEDENEFCPFFNPLVLHPGCHLTSCHPCAADKTIKTSSEFWNGSVEQCRRCNSWGGRVFGHNRLDNIFRRCNDGFCYQTKLVGCDGKKDCQDGSDEWGCPWYTQVSATNTLATCFGFVCVSLIVFMMLKKTKFIVTTVENYEEPMEIDLSKVDKFINKMKASPEINEEVKQNYHEIHMRNQISVLISAFNIFFIGLTNSHKITRLILELEYGIHGGRRQALLCLRVNGGSNVDIERLLTFEDDPGYLKKLKKKMVQAVDAFLSQCYIQPLVACFPNITKWTYNITKNLIAGAKVTVFLWDFAKDLVLWAILYGKADELNITESENLMLWIFFSLIFCGQSIMGLYITSKYKTILSLPKCMKTWKKVFVLIAMFLLTPCLPSLVIFKATVYSTDMAALVTNARNDPNSQPSAVLQEISIIREKYMIHMQIYAYARVIEATLETFPQVIVLSSFLTRSSTLGNILLDKENLSSPTSMLFLISIPYSMMMTVTAIIGFINTQKRRSLGFLTSSILGISYLFQLTSSYISWLIIFGTSINGFSLWGNMILVLITLGITWLFTYIWTYKVAKPFSKAPILERMLHVLVNTFVTIPFRDAKDQSQRRKSMEIFWHLLFHSFGNLAMVTIECYLVSGFPENISRILSYPIIDFLNLYEHYIPLSALFPVCLFFQLLGGLFMWIFYKNHHWKEINDSSFHFCCFPSTPCLCSLTGLCKILGCFFFGFIQIIFCCCCDLWIIWWRCLPLHKFRWVGWEKKKFDIPDRNTLATDELVSLIPPSLSLNTQQEQRLQIHSSSETSLLSSIVPTGSSTIVPTKPPIIHTMSYPFIFSTGSPKIQSTKASIIRAKSCPSQVLTKTTNRDTITSAIVSIKSSTLRSISRPPSVPSRYPLNRSKSCPSLVETKSTIRTKTTPRIISTKSATFIPSFVLNTSPTICANSCFSVDQTQPTIVAISTHPIVPNKSVLIHATSSPILIPTGSPIICTKSCPSIVPTESTTRTTPSCTTVPNESAIIRAISSLSLVPTESTTSHTTVPNESATSSPTLVPTSSHGIHTISCPSLFPTQSTIRATSIRTIDQNECATILATESHRIRATSCSFIVSTRSSRLKEASSPCQIRSISSPCIISARSSTNRSITSLAIVSTKSSIIRSLSVPSKSPLTRSISMPSKPSPILFPTIHSKPLKIRSTSCPSLTAAFPQLPGMKTDNGSMPHLKASENP